MVMIEKYFTECNNIQLQMHIIAIYSPQQFCHVRNHGLVEAEGRLDPCEFPLVLIMSS